MVKKAHTYCTRCGEKVTKRPYVTLMQDFNEMPGELVDDYIDLCRSCWEKAKKFFNLE
jgi:thymidine kinase